MKRRSLVTLAAGCAGLGCVPAFAGTSPQAVDTGRTAAVMLTVPLSDGDTLNLDLKGAQMSTGPELLIQEQRCTQDEGCMTEGDFLSPLAAGELTIDPSIAVARLQTSLAGRDLVISWRPANGAVVGAGYIDGGGTSADASNFVGDAADVTVQYDGSSCTGSGGVGQGFAGNIALAGDSATSPVADLKLPSGTTLGCDS